MPITPEQEQEFIKQNQIYSAPQNAFLAQVSQMPQDQAVKILRLSMQAGIDPVEAARNPTAAIQNLIGATDFEDVGKFAPKTYSFLNDPLHMAIARDKRNVMTLADMENENKVWTSFKNGVKDLGRNTIGFLQGIADNLAKGSETNRDNMPPEYKMWSEQGGTKVLQNTATSLAQAANSDVLKPKEVKADTAVGQYGLDFVRTAPQIAAQVAAAILTGGTGSMLFMGTQIAGGEYLKLREEGVASDRAFQASVLDATAQAPLERIGLNKIMKKLPAGTPRKIQAREVVEAGLTEGLTEWIQQYPEAAIEIWARHPEYTPEQRGAQFMKDFADITKEGAYQGLVAAPFGFLGGAVKVSMQKKVTETFVNQLETQQAILANSPILQTSPELVEKHLEAVSGGDKTYIDPEAVLTLYQSGMLSQEEIDALLGTTATEVAEAASTGQMVEVSTAKYTVATAQHPEIHQALKEDIAPDEDGMTLRRLTERNTQDIKQAQDEVKKQRAEVKAESDKIFEQMKAAGVRDDVAKSALVALVKNAYVMSDNPAQWLRDKGPIFQRGAASPEGSLHQFAGPSAKTADHLGLSQAKQMEKDGADNEAIRKATGWHKGMEGKWRFEIDDSQAALIDQGQLQATSKEIETLYKQANKANDPAVKEELMAKADALAADYDEATKPRLKNVLHHPALYQAYPWIANAKVIQSKLSAGENGGYDPATNTIQVSKDLSPDKLRETLLHEIQHVIQEQEDFARGGSPEGVSEEAFNQYQRLAGEVEARDTASRADLTEEQRKEIAPDIRSDAIVVHGGKEIAYNPEKGYNIGNKDGSEYEVEGSSYDAILRETGEYEESVVVRDAEGNAYGPDARSSAVRTPGNRSGKTIGLAVTPELVEHGVISLVGRTARSPKELATISHVLRHPGYEKFHVVYVSGDKVVHHETISAGLPDRANIMEAGQTQGQFFQRIDNNLSIFGADGYYLIHNHPSGDPRPSGADVSLTKHIANITTAGGNVNNPVNRGFKGHVVLDHTTYTFIGRDGGHYQSDIDTTQIPDESYDATSLPHWSLETSITSPTAVAGLAAGMNLDPNNSVVFYLTTKHKVRGVQVVPNALLADEKKAVRYLRMQARNHYSARFVIVTDNDQTYNTSRELVKNYEHVLDVYHASSKRFGMQEVSKNANPDEWMGILDKGGGTRLLEDIGSLYQNNDDKRGSIHWNEEGRAISVWLLTGFTKGQYKKPPVSPEDVGPSGTTLSERSFTEGAEASLDNSIPKPGELFQSQNITDTPAFRAWFGDSKAVDEHGKPLVLYHGTNAEFDTFDSAYQNQTHAQYGQGFYFAESPEMAKLYGDRVIPVYLRATYGLPEKRADRKAGRPLKEIDYIHVKEKGIWVVKKPEQIKSINNRGTFDPNNPNIFMQIQGSPKGSIHWNEEGRAIITLFQNADPSTVIHEMVGHYFVQNLIDQGARDDAPAWMKKDRKAALAYAGIEDWETATKEQRIQAHEKLARAAEAYMMEGKAPSIETRSMFKRFKEWLTKIYDTVSGLGVELSPEIRGVFDRMLATEEEIAAVEFTEGYHGRLPAEVWDKLTDAQKNELDRYALKANEQAENLLRGKVMLAISADNKYEMDKAREELTAQFTEEVSKEPLYLAADQISNNFQKDAKVVAQAFKDSMLFGEDLSKGLSQDQEAEFEYLADVFGFSSGDELATKILNSNTKAEEIAYRVQTQMNIRFKDLMQNPDLMRQEAEEAMYTDEGADYIAAQMQALMEKRLGQIADREQRHRQVVFQREEAKRQADKLMSRMPIEKAIRLHSYIAATQRAAIKADKAVREGKLDEAYEYKQQQILNHAMVMKSLEIRRQFEKTTKYLKRQQKSDKATWKKEEHFVQAAEILRRFGFLRKDYEPLMKKESLAEWAKRMDETMQSVAIADWILLEKFESDPKKLTLEQLRDVENAVRNIKRLAQTENAFVKLFKQADIAEVVATSADKLADAKDIYVKEPEEDVSPQNSLKKSYREYSYSSEKITTFLNRLDKWHDFGWFHNLIYRPVYEAANQVSKLLHIIKEKEEASLWELCPTKEAREALDKRVYYEELGASVSKRYLLEMASHVGSESNRRVLFGKPPVGLEKSSLWVRNADGKVDAETMAMTQDRVMNFLAQNLTAAEWKWVQRGWDNINLLWPLAQEVHQRMTGFSMQKVEELPFETKTADGQTIVLQGGYYPLKEDYRANSRAAKREEEREGQPLYTETFAMSVPKTFTGYTHERTGATYSIDLRQTNRYRHIQAVAHDIAFREVITDLRRLVNNTEFKELLETKTGPEGYRMIREFIAVAANPKTEAATIGQNTIDKLANWLRERTIIAALMLNMKTALQNLSNPFLYGNAVDGFSHVDALNGFLNRGAFRFWTQERSYREDRDFVLSKSAFMRDRVDSPDYTLNEFKNDENFWMKWGGKLLAETDNLTAVPMWLEAYHKKLGEGASEADAIFYADTLIDRAIGSGRKIDTASIMRGNATTRLITMFGTFMNTQFNSWKREFGIALRDRDAIRLFTTAAARWLLFSISGLLLAFDLPDQDDDKWVNRWASEILAYPVRLFPVVGNLAAVAINRSIGGSSFGVRLSPVESMGETAVQALLAPIGYIQGKKTGADMAESIMSAAAFLRPYPDQFNHWFWNAYDILFNDMEPESGDLLKRRPRRER